MAILQLPYAPTIGVLVGVTAFIPYVGAYLGAIVGFIIILTVNPFKAVIFVVFLVVFSFILTLCLPAKNLHQVCQYNQLILLIHLLPCRLLLYIYLHYCYINCPFYIIYYKTIYNKEASLETYTLSFFQVSTTIPHLVYKQFNWL